MTSVYIVIFDEDYKHCRKGDIACVKDSKESAEMYVKRHTARMRIEAWVIS